MDKVHRMMEEETVTDIRLFGLWRKWFLRSYNKQVFGKKTMASVASGKHTNDEMVNSEWNRLELLKLQWHVWRFAQVLNGQRKKLCWTLFVLTLAGITLKHQFIVLQENWRRQRIIEYWIVIILQKPYNITLKKYCVYMWWYLCSN